MLVPNLLRHRRRRAVVRARRHLRHRLRSPDSEILAKVKAAFDFRPGMMGKALDLKRGGNKRYQTTAAYGHFGSDEDLDIFTWEKVVPL